MPYVRSLAVFTLSCVISRCLELMITLPKNTRTLYCSHCHKICTCSITHTHHAKWAHAVLLKLPQNKRTRYFSDCRKTRARDIIHTATKCAHEVLFMHTSQNKRMQYYSCYLKTCARGITHTPAKHAHAILLTLPQNTRRRNTYDRTPRTLVSKSEWYCDTKHRCGRRAKAHHRRHHDV